MRFIFACGLTAGCLLSASTALAASAESQVSGLDLKKCVVTHIAKEADDGTALKRKDWAPDTWRCNGLGGWSVFVVEGDLRPAVAFSRATKFDGPWQSFPKFASTGLRVEWRGSIVKTEFKPAAAILRFDWADDRGKGSVLGVARLDREQAKTCLFAYVDTNANKDADAIADDLADTKAASALCPEDGVVAFVGQVSEALK